MGNGFSVFCNQIDVEPKIIKIFPKKVKFNPNTHDQCVQYAEPLNNEHDGDVNDNESDTINDDRWRNDVKDRIKSFYYDDYLDKYNDDECRNKEKRQNELQYGGDLSVKQSDTTSDNKDTSEGITQEETNHHNQSIYTDKEICENKININEENLHLRIYTSRYNIPNCLKSIGFNLNIPPETHVFQAPNISLQSMNSTSSTVSIVQNSEQSAEELTSQPNKMNSSSCLPTPTDKFQLNSLENIQMSDLYDKHSYPAEQVQNCTDQLKFDKGVQCQICCKQPIQLQQSSKTNQQSEEDKSNNSEKLSGNENSYGVEVNGDKIKKPSRKIPILSVNSVEIIDSTDYDSPTYSETTLYDENVFSLNDSQCDQSFDLINKEMSCNEVAKQEDKIQQTEKPTTTNHVTERCGRTNQIRLIDTDVQFEYENEDTTSITTQDVTSQSEGPKSIDITKEGNICTPTVQEKLLNCSIINEIESTQSLNIDRESTKSFESYLSDHSLTHCISQYERQIKVDDGIEEKEAEDTHYPDRSITTDSEYLIQTNDHETFQSTRPTYVQVVDRLGYCLNGRLEAFNINDTDYIQILAPINYLPKDLTRIKLYNLLKQSEVEDKLEKSCKADISVSHENLLDKLINHTPADNKNQVISTARSEIGDHIQLYPKSEVNS
ncbi:unnamed protein product [Trichobilharzia szidati]|nr:unnamed protein product [Trichobilharzia szidati]